MDKGTKQLLKLAEAYGHNPEEFIDILERTFSVVPSDRKPYLFFAAGSMLCELSYLELASVVYNKSLEYCVKSKNRAGEEDCYVTLGMVYYRLGNFRKAIQFHDKLLERRTGIDRKAESQCYGNLGLAYLGLGQLRQAIEYSEKSLEIAIEIGDDALESIGYLNLGVAFGSVFDYERAIQFIEKSLKKCKKIHDEPGESRCYACLGVAYTGLRDNRKAIEFIEKSLKIKRRIRDRAGESKCYANLGVAYGQLGDVRKAMKYLTKSLGINEKNGEEVGAATCYTEMGTLLVSEGSLAKDRESLTTAIKLFEKSLEISKKVGDANLQRMNNLYLAIVYGDHLGELGVAYDYCRESIELSEIVSGGLVEEEHKIGFSGSISKSYHYMIPLCLKLKKGNEAFEYVERSKSRAFLDLLAATNFEPYAEVTSELRSLLEDEELYLGKLREIQTRHLRQTRVSVGPAELDRIYENLNLIYDRIEQFDPEYVFTRRGKPLSLDKIQHMLSSQQRDVVLIEYFVDEDEISIFVVSSHNRELHVETVPLSLEKLNRHMDNYWREVVHYPNFKDIGDSWLGLSRYLIDPISKHLTEGELIYFIPYGSLHYLPLHALELNGEPLIKEHPVAYSPSASLIKFCQNKGSGKLQSCASFGMIFEKEAQNVSELFDAVYCKSATKIEVIENCTDKDVIHFSCHGYFDDVDPLHSGVELHDDILTAREIFNLRLNAELITLSACQTGLNMRSPGDELIGLTRAFLYAGTASVIVSLWSVDAYSTQELMLEFYNLLKNGVDKATALQEAQKRTMGREAYSHPYYWAPFVLIGDWE